MRIGAAGTDLPAVKETFREQFEQKYTYPALEIAYLAIDKKFQSLHLGSALIEEIASMARNQRYAGCVFLTVRAWHTSDYSAVGFYEKNQFAKIDSSSPNGCLANVQNNLAGGMIPLCPLPLLYPSASDFQFRYALVPAKDLHRFWA